MARKDAANFLCIILAFTITRYDATLFSADHEFRWLEAFDDDQLEERRVQLTIVGSYSNDMAPKACSSRLFFSTSNINVSLGSDSFLVSHQSTLNTHKTVLFIDRYPEALLCHPSRPRRTPCLISIVTRVFCRQDHDGCVRSTIDRRAYFPCVYRIYLNGECLSHSHITRSNLQT